MSPSRILVTGAAGFVGRHLLPKLRQSFPNADLVASGTAGSDAWLRPLDVTDKDAVTALVRSLKPDACIHLAGVTAVPAANADPDLAWRVNLHGTLVLARALKEHVPDCRMIHVSSAEVYGLSFHAGVPVDEIALPSPMNTYAATKAAAEVAMKAMACEGLNVVVLRPFNHTGPGQSANFVVAAFARQIARIEAGLQPPVMRVGALDPFRDFLDVADVCEAYVACLRLREAERGMVMNIASGKPQRIGGVLRALLDLAGVEAKIETGPTLIRPTDIPSATGNAARARLVLGWKPTIPWETTLRSVLEDWRERVRHETD